MKPSSIPALVDALAAEVKARKAEPSRAEPSRAELSCSQEDPSAKHGLNRPYISLREVGRKQLALSVMFRLAYGLDLTLEERAGRIERRYGRHKPDWSFG